MQKSPGQKTSNASTFYAVCGSSNVNEVIRAVLSPLFIYFFSRKDFARTKSTKSTNSTESTKMQPSKSTKTQISE